MSKVKLIVAALLIVALAAVGAGWKWKGGTRKTLGSGQSHLIAGWSWGDHMPSMRGDHNGGRDAVGQGPWGTG